MGSEEANALQGRDPLHLPHQRREATAPAWISVVVHVLAQEDDFPGAFQARLPALGDDLLERAVELAAANTRDDAEGAAVIAALDHVHVVADSGAAGNRQRLAPGPVVAGVELLDEGAVVSDRHHGVEVWKALLERVALLLDQAAGQGDRPLRRLPATKLVQLRVDLLLAGLADDAGVQDGDVGAGRVR